MKIIKYNLIAHDENGEEIKGSSVSMRFSEANLGLAEAEAWQEHVEILDDGLSDPAPSPQSDTDAMLVDHEYRLTILELGV